MSETRKALRVALNVDDVMLVHRKSIPLFVLKHSWFSAIKAYLSKARSQQSGAAEACWAHNPEVGGSKPLSATFFYENTCFYMH